MNKEYGEVTSVSITVTVSDQFYNTDYAVVEFPTNGTREIIENAMRAAVELLFRSATAKFQAKKVAAESEQESLPV